MKVPLFPFHTWLPDAHVEAPTAGSVLLAGVLLKMGTYGMLRFNLGLFPDQARSNAPWIMALALIGIIYGALVAMVQPNMKKLIAYSSVSHLGFVVLGIFSFTQSGLNGAVFVMLAHGVSTGALFMLAGILHERRHTYEISEFGGLATPMPVYAAFFLFIMLASVGLPLLNGFVGEFLVLSGAFQAKPIYGILAATGVIWSACYLLWMYPACLLWQGDAPGQQRAARSDRIEKAAVVALRRRGPGDGRCAHAVAGRHRSGGASRADSVHQVGEQGGGPMTAHTCSMLDAGASLRRCRLHSHPAGAGAVDFRHSGHGRWIRLSTRRRARSARLHRLRRVRSWHLLSTCFMASLPGLAFSNMVRVDTLQRLLHLPGHRDCRGRDPEFIRVHGGAAHPRRRILRADPVRRCRHVLMSSAVELVLIFIAPGNLIDLDLYPRRLPPARSHRAANRR